MKNYGLTLLMGLGLCASAHAGTFSISPDPAVAVRGAAGQFDVLFAGGGTDEAQLDITFDTAGITLVPTVLVPGSTCGVNVAGHTIRVVPPSGAGTALPAAATPYCRYAITTAADAVLGSRPITLDLAECEGSLGADASCAFSPTAAVNVTDAPPVPPTVTFNPNGGPIVLTAPAGTDAGQQSNATVIAITAVGGSGGGTGSYTCTAPGGPFTITNPTNGSIAAGSDPDDISVSCTLGLTAQNGAFSCSRTGGSVTPVNFTVSCPAGDPVPVAIFASTPAPGTQLNCDGEPGAITQTQVTIRNVGSPGVGSELNYSCTTGSAGFSVTTNGAGVVAVGGSSVVTVGCTVPAEDAPPATGTLNCTSNAANAPTADYPLSAAVDLLPEVTPPQFVPASSLWSQLSLIGILAALGLLVVGIRRR